MCFGYFFKSSAVYFIISNKRNFELQGILLYQNGS